MEGFESPFNVWLLSVIADTGQVLYTAKEASELVDRSIPTLRRWRNRNFVEAPSKRLVWKKKVIYLYTEADIDELREFARDMKPGRRTDLE
jgi:DNA-binding transcriptional MerR regulator